MILFDINWRRVFRRETIKRVKRSVEAGDVLPAEAYRLWGDGGLTAILREATDHCRPGQWFGTLQEGRWRRTPATPTDWEAARTGRVAPSGMEAGWQDVVGLPAEEGDVVGVFLETNAPTYNANSVGRYMANQLPTLVPAEALAELRGVFASPPPEARKKASGPSGLVRAPTEDEREQIRAVVGDLRAQMATCPEAAGRSRLSLEGVLLAPQALVAEKAKVRPSDLTAALNGRRPSSLSVATILERLQGLLPETGPWPPCAGIGGVMHIQAYLSDNPKYPGRPITYCGIVVYKGDESLLAGGTVCPICDAVRDGTTIADAIQSTRRAIRRPQARKTDSGG